MTRNELIDEIYRLHARARERHGAGCIIDRARLNNFLLGLDAESLEAVKSRYKRLLEDEQ